MYTYTLKNIEVLLHLGVEASERTVSQKVLISLEFSFDGSVASGSDDIKDTVDYFEIQQYIKNFPEEKSFALLEKLHQTLQQGIEKKFPTITVRKLTLEKFPFKEGSVLIS